MKEKKNYKVRKVLLVAVSCVLVSAISVSATLAYLTAKTAPKTNKFTATENLKGEVVENFPNGTPVGSVDGKFNYASRPNETVVKQPKIDNDSPHEKEMFVAAKVQFKIKSAADADSAQSFKEVTQAHFEQFVTVAWNIATGDAPVNEDDAGKWYKITSSDPDDKASYFVYSTHLDPDDQDGTGLEMSGVDTTSQIFNSVTVKKEVNLDATNGIKLLDSHVTAGTLTNTYNGFEYQIIISGFGVDNEENETLSDGTNALKTLMGIA